MSNIAIIPARGGSTRVPRKNIRLFHGKPIIAYSIETAKASWLFDQVYVSSDDDEILTIAVKYGASVLLRSEGLGHDSVGTQEVVRDALRNPLGAHYICCIYATAPLITPRDLIQGLIQLRWENAPYVYTVGPDFQDAGQWYWGTYEAFRDSVPLDHGKQYFLPSHRVCDINTEEDWMRAERMYEALHGTK